MSDLPSSLLQKLRDSAQKVMPGVPRDQLLAAADEIERLRAELQQRSKPCWREDDVEHPCGRFSE